MKNSIPMDEVFKRYTRIKPIALNIYPLYSNYKENYNFSNIMESVNNWLSFTGKEGPAFKKLLELYDLTLKHGFAENADIIAGRIETIARSSENPSELRQFVLNKIKDEASSFGNCKGAKTIYNALSEAIQCERVIKNHNIFSKRFNIDSYVRENAIIEDNLYDTIYELCSFIDTYKLGLDSKFSIALEETMFALYKNSFNVDTKSIVECVTDYFLSNHLESDDSKMEILNILESATEKNIFISESDAEYFDELKVAIHENCSEGVVLENLLKDKSKELIDKFKLLPAKSESAFKNLITNLLVVNKDSNIIDGTKNVLSIIFYFTVVVGSFSIGFIPGIIGMVAAKTINTIAERSEFTKVLKVWYAKRDSVSKKVDSCKDPEKKKRLEEYLKTIDKQITKIEDYSDSLRGDDEKKSWDSRPSNYSKKDDDTFDMNFNFDEESKLCANDIGMISEALSSIKWDKDNIQNVLFASENVVQIKAKDIRYLSEFAIKYPGMIDYDKFIEALSYADRTVQKEPGYDNFDKLSAYTEAITKLDKAKDDDDIKKIAAKDIIDVDVFSDIGGMCEATNAINSYVTSIQELGITSTITMAAQKLSSKISDLSDKEKIISRTIDAACRIMSHGVERAMTMENREAVIRGDILPPASKVIKIAATTGIAAFIHPALAVIMLLGRFALNSKIRAKERQLVVNELEVEQKMIKSYIDDAHEKKDYKKERELRLIQKKLESQYARLKYNSKIAAPDDAHYEKNEDDD